MSRPHVKTVRVKSPYFAEGILINADDFNPDLDSLFGMLKPEPRPDKTKAK